ncbi:MAG: flavin reductase family protein [Methylacidiphilales bacterium]|nr:flavin reductase family protein [Candidatus Methylacidiphilales bacterium]
MQLKLSELSAGKRYGILSSLVLPRPIAWVTTLNEDGSVNAAPFSYFQLMGENPPLVVLGIGKRSNGAMKDSFRNLRRTQEFVINIVTEENAEAMSLSSTEFPPGVSETEALGLATEPSVLVKPPRLSVAPAQLEARELQTLLIGGNQVVMGELLMVHIRDEFIDAKTLHVQTDKMHVVGRLQGGEAGGYTRTRDAFHLKRLSYDKWQAKEKPAKG